MENQTESNAEVIFEHEDNWTTDDIVRIDGEYYKRHQNGGSQGAWDHRQFRPKCEAITRTEARRLALEWGYDLEDVATKLA